MCACVSLFVPIYLVPKSRSESQKCGQASIKDTAAPLHKKPEETLVIVQQHLKHQSTFRSQPVFF